MINLLKKSKEGYWSKSWAFLLPLTGFPRNDTFNIKTYLYWKNYSIENYQLIVTFEYEDYDQFLRYCEQTIFPNIKVPIIESYDLEGKSVFILDLSEWAL